MIKMKIGLTFLLAVMFAAGLLGPLAAAALAQSRPPGPGAVASLGQPAVQAPDPRTQRRIELRSELQKQRPVTEDELSARPTMQAATMGPVNRHLTAQEREEMRQQLREQFREQRQQIEQREQQTLSEQRQPGFKK